eukprot:13900651-Alexandrium_andersonii.AAC.1
MRKSSKSKHALLRRVPTPSSGESRLARVASGDRGLPEAWLGPDESALGQEGPASVWPSRH